MNEIRLQRVHFMLRHGSYLAPRKYDHITEDNEWMMHWLPIRAAGDIQAMATLNLQMSPWLRSRGTSPMTASLVSSIHLVVGFCILSAASGI